MSKQLPAWLRNALYNLRGGFLVRPLIIALVLGFLGALFSGLEESFPGAEDWVPRLLFPSHADPQVAQVILAGIAASIMTVVSIVFAILLMTLTLASMQFSPRIIIGFVRDRVTQWTLGIFLGTFLYCMAALPTARSLPRPFAPVATVTGAIVLAIACVAWLLFFIHHIASAISVSNIVDRIATETERTIDETMPRPYRKPAPQPPAMPVSEALYTSLTSEKSGYIRYIDLQRLVGLAKANHVRVHVVRRVGQFVPAGTPLLTVYKGSRLTAQAGEDFRGAFDLGPSRTLQQDLEFGILQIVDIALRAISPAVNDPSTGINCVDHLSRILIRFASREPAPDVYYDPPGTPRVEIGWAGFSSLLDTAFEQIRMYAKGDLAVSLRLLRALGDIALTTSDPDHLQAVQDRMQRVIEGCAEELGPGEMEALHKRLATLSAEQKKA